MALMHRLALGAALLCAASTASAEVQLSLKDGRVTLAAKDATVRQILTEWARVGQTRIINVERIPGGPVTLQFNNVPEEEALDILLRGVSGYMAAPRPAAVSNLSRYDRIMVMPNAPAPRAASSVAAPVFQQPAPPPVAQEEPEPPAQGQAVPTVLAPARGPIFQTFPQPQVANPPVENQTPNTNDPPENPVPPAATIPVGVPRPGMVLPAPEQPAPPTRTAQPTSQPSAAPTPGR